MCIAPVRPCSAIWPPLAGTTRSADKTSDAVRALTAAGYGVAWGMGGLIVKLCFLWVAWWSKGGFKEFDFGWWSHCLKYVD